MLITFLFSLLSSSFLSKDFKIEIYKTIILPVVLYGCETWSLALREGRKLRVFENGECLDVRRKEWCEAGKDCIMSNLIICTLHQIFLG
jgi:hypothetical protein